MAELEKIDGECKKYDVDFVKIENNEEAEDYGVELLPALIYFENRIPSLYDGDLMDEESVLEWLVVQKTSDTIEQVTDKILEKLIEEERDRWRSLREKRRRRRKKKFEGQKMKSLIN